MKKMQAIQILVLFSVFLAQCYNSVNAALRREDLEVRGVHIVQAGLFEDIIKKETSLFKEFPEGKTQTENIYNLDTSYSVELSTSYDESGEFYTVKTPKIDIDILGGKYRHKCFNIEKSNALDLELVVNLMVDDHYSYQFFDITKHSEYSCLRTDFNIFSLEFCPTSFSIQPKTISVPQIKDGPKKNKVKVLIKALIKSTVRPDVYVDPETKMIPQRYPDNLSDR